MIDTCERKYNKSGKVHSLEYIEMPEAFFTAQHGR
jgi:hypothetical protein